MSRLPRKSVVVTGGAGFIGSNTVEALLKKRCRVTVLDNLSTAYLENLKPFLSKIRFVRGDIRDRRAVKSALKGADRVIHLAAIRSVADSVEDPMLCHDVDATGTLTLLDESVKARIKRFVYASSSAVYGDKVRLPQSEDDLTRPESPYGAAKLAGELYSINFFLNEGLPTVSLRYFNVYGPRQNPESRYSAVVPAFIEKLRKGKRCVIDGTGRQARDFVYVDDVARANVQACFGSSASAGKVFNIGCGKAYSVMETFRILSRTVGQGSFRYGPKRPGDALKSMANISTARKVLRWKPTVNFLQGLKKTVTWFEMKKR